MSKNADKSKTAHTKSKPGGDRSKSKEPSKTPAKAKPAKHAKSVSKAAVEPVQGIGRMLYLLLNTSQQWLTANFETTMRERFGITLTVPQFAYLNTVKLRPNASQTYICLTTQIDRSTVSTVGARLMEHGHLTRTRTSNDTRTYAVALTPSGEELVAKGIQVMRDLESKMRSLTNAKGAESWLSELASHAMDSNVTHNRRGGAYHKDEQHVASAREGSFAPASGSGVGDGSIGAEPGPALADAA